MKNTWLILFASLTTSAAHAQQLQGYFMSTTKAWVTDLLLFQGNHFTYDQSTCTDLVKGSGLFTVRHDTLRLHFDNSIGPMPTVTARPAQTPDSIAVQVLDGANNTPLLGVTVIIKPGEANGKQRGTFTNADGRARLAHVPAILDSLLITYVGYETQRIPLAGFGGKCLKISLTTTRYVPPGTTYCYPLESFHQNSFTAHLTADEKSSFAHFHYRRITASKAAAVLKQRGRRQ